MHMTVRVLLLAFLALPLFFQSGWATGLSKSVLIGPKAMGMGGAFVGIADDTTAIFHNPAGITQLKGHHFEAGMDGLFTNLEYTPPAGAKEKAETEFLPVPRFGFVTDYFKLVTLGLGVYFPHGNGGKFPAASSVPTNPNEGRIYSLEIAPAIAWQVVPQLSIGATLRIVRISNSLKGQAVLLPNGTPDMLRDLSLSGWGVGASAGVLYRPCRYFSFGANYRSTIKTDVDGTATFQSAALGAQSASLNQTLPTLVNAGFGFYPLEKLTLGLSYEFERNSEVHSLKLTLPKLPAPNSFTLPQNWNDSHTIHFGGEYWILPALAVRTGYAKDLVRSIPNAVMNRITGDIASHELSAGLAYKWRRYDFAATWNARFGERTIPVSGTTNVAPGKYEGFLNSVSVGVGVGI